MGAVSDDHKPSVDAAVDLLLYAPLGFALEARSLLPRFVERGRNQVTMAKMVGQFAVQQGQVEASKRLGPVQEQIETALADLGLVARPSAPMDTAAAATPSTPASPAPTTEPVAATPAPEPDAPAADELAIPDYDSLAASQVVPRLRALGADDLEAVRRYETAGRGRKTILNRIAQIQAR